MSIEFPVIEPDHDRCHKGRLAVTYGAGRRQVVSDLPGSLDDCEVRGVDGLGLGVQPRTDRLVGARKPSRRRGPTHTLTW